MPNELAIKSVAAVTGASENPAEPQAEAFIPPAHAPPPPSASPMPNPQLRLDAALGLVVIEFRDEAGTITTSIPSQRQLNAYRMWEQNRLNPSGLPQSMPGEPQQAPGTTPPGTATSEGGG